MTGRELIVYILQNGLEDVDVFMDGKFVGFATAEEAAAKKQVGVATIQAWMELGYLDGVTIKPGVYIPVNKL